LFKRKCEEIYVILAQLLGGGTALEVETDPDYHPGADSDQGDVQGRGCAKGAALRNSDVAGVVAEIWSKSPEIICFSPFDPSEGRYAFRPK
jgi:hypothetical protein